MDKFQEILNKLPFGLCNIHGNKIVCSYWNHSRKVDKDTKPVSISFGEGKTEVEARVMAMDIDRTENG
jgi:hypothetical protein